MIEDKYIGLALSIASTLGIGSSFVITKKGLIEAEKRHGFEGEGHQYLKSPLWWSGMVSLAVGEAANFAAYAFAPAILVTPLGALSVLIGAVLGAYILGETLGTLGKIGCAECLIGSLIIVLHAPPDKDIQTIDEILNYAVQPGFLFYCAVVTAFAFFMIYRVAPQYGRKNPLVYLSICSSVGSISVMSIKAFGIALKLTLGGNNQFTHPSTYVFLIIVVICILTQMNYFNKALSQFSTNIVNPLYYVTFTTFTLCASFILFQGFNTTDPVNTISLLCGFLVIFSGVYLLNFSRKNPEGHQTVLGDSPDSIDEEDASIDAASRLSMHAIPTDGIAGFETQRNMQLKRSGEHSRLSNGSFSRNGTSRSRLMYGYDGHARDTEHQSPVGAEQYSLGEMSGDESGDDGHRKDSAWGYENGKIVR